ncbi:predicted protein [Naegleria gruberi]|uniref:Predicted protein n=1 Tax=Naegleria gruberi TaxID=5762 RepID=D2W208_NAEGR|nr:uncharacterized protein NAEGRDRAFT_75417 [Naegleria gruberi]EFC36856.1 predicted protein [Naegleria gruberi]|eukprot:XP_002669600.1 predicted protein [Naegleria gruberi strain NEG-M]
MSTQEQADKWFETNMDVWYDAIVDLTFRTRMISLSEEQIMAIILDNEYFNGECNQEVLETSGIDIVSSLNSDTRRTVLETLEIDVNREMKELSCCNDEGCFIKLSCRSPKDAFAVCAKMKELFNDKIEKIVMEKKGVLATPNERLIAVNESFIQSMKVKDFAEEYTYFTKSARVLEDLLLFLKYDKKQREENPIKIIIREWVDIPSKYEFRSFVKNKQLTAISQYFDTFAHRVPLNDYICDFAIDSNGRVYIVELNPFSTTTDACLFSWTKDGEILNGIQIKNETNQLDQIEFRLKKEVEKHLKHQIISVWVPFVIPSQ